MDFIVWLNSFFLTFAAVAEGIIVYVVLPEVVLFGLADKNCRIQ
jgi:hypothetical protein